MAKSKKSESLESKPAKKPAAASAKKGGAGASEDAANAKPAKADVRAKPATKAGGKSPGTSSPGSVQTFNPSHAAANAAAMIGARLTPPATAGAAGGPKKESSAFKMIKQGMASPHSAAIGNILDKTASPASQKSNLPFGHNVGKQVGRNQTFGADATRTGVPRRTGG
jgi:hypothetical protein